MHLDLFEINISDDIDKDNMDSYFFDCQCAILLVNIMEENGIKKIQDLFDNYEFKKYPYLKFILAENKIDLEDQRKLPDTVIDKFIENKSELIRERIKLSVKDGQGFDELKEKINIFVNKTPNNECVINKVMKQKDNQTFETKAKDELFLLLLGDSKVGKTTFFNRFNYNQFQEDLVSTIGIDSLPSLFKIGGVVKKVTITDTAGQDRYRSLAKQYYCKANGILLLYDVGSRDSFDNITLWMDQIKDNAKEKDKIAVYFIGNKIDSPRQVSKKEAEEKAQFLGLKYFEMSCKINMNVMEILARIVNDCYEKSIDNENKEEPTSEPSIRFNIKSFKNSGKKEGKKGNCCNGKEK